MLCFLTYTDAPLVQTRPAISSTWESTCNSKYSMQQMKAENFGGIHVLSHPTGVQFSDALSRSVPPKGARSEIFDPG